MPPFSFTFATTQCLAVFSLNPEDTKMRMAVRKYGPPSRGKPGVRFHGWELRLQAAMHMQAGGHLSKQGEIKTKSR